MVLSLPLDLFDVPPGGELVTRVVKWEEGTGTIKPLRAPQGIEVPIIRLYVPAADKVTEPRYWDITATTLHPSLRATLPEAVRTGRYIRILKVGAAPRARFMLELKPVGFPGPAFVGLR